MNTSRRLVSAAALLFLTMMGVSALQAQDANSVLPDIDGTKTQPSNVEKPDPLKRQLTDKEKRAQQKELRGELHGVYKKWLDEDVRWIITDQERNAFKNLSNDEE